MQLMHLKKIDNLRGAFLVVASLLLGVASLASCGGGHTISASSGGGEEIKMRYAEYISISEHPGFTEVTVRNPWDTLRTLGRYLLVPADSALPPDLPKGTVIRTPVTNALVYSAVHAGLISELNASEAIGGVCEPQYIQDTTLQRRLSEGLLVDCGNSQNPDVERIIKLRPQVIMLSPYENNDMYARVGELGIPIVECADYMETSPLGRAEWMRFFGLLFGKRDMSEKMFGETEAEYLRLKEKTAEVSATPSVLFDQRYGQVWYVPGKGSTVDRLIEDAGGLNPFAAYGRGGSVALSPEKVLAEAHDADVWFVRYNQQSEKTLAELAKDFPMNSRFKAYKDGNVYGCNTRYVNFYGETPFHPDRLLRDMIKVVHPGLLDTDIPATYYKKMK